MVDFANMPKQEEKYCQDCGQQFRGFPEQPRCTQCHYDSMYPEEAPKYWTWKKRGQNWIISATWPDREPLPNVGETVTVHRKDGSSSDETITEVDRITYDMSGRAKLRCLVK